AGLYVAPHSQGREAGRLAGAAATGIELLINVKTTKVLGLDMPPTLFAGADEVTRHPGGSRSPHSRHPANAGAYEYTPLLALIPPPAANIRCGDGSRFASPCGRG